MFDFIHITHLDDIRHAISDDFYLADREWGWVINYHINAFPELKDDMTDEEKALEHTRREFRGIKFDRLGNIAARPFHKFFNWGEKEAEMAHFDFNQPFDILDKLDGSMIHPMFIGDDIAWCSKMGTTDVGLQAQTFVAKHQEYETFANEWMHSGWTPIFEWCSRQQRIVVDYPEDQLVLTAIRNNQTGNYLSRTNLETTAAQHNIPLVRCWKGDFKGIEAFVEEIGGEDQCEGYIIRFANGHMVKLKNSWYLNLHRAKSKLDSEKNVYILVLNQDHDDLLPQLDDQARDGLEKFAAKLANAIKFEAGFYDIAVKSAWAHYGNRKDFALNFASKAPWPAVAFKILDGKDAYDAVVDFALAHCATQAKLDTIKPRLGNLNWRDYYYPVDMCDD